ncbi:MAG: hypothetical protein JWP03_1572 [Phycisphaerales bacterium]|jgi:hypothetical protein|nr:hypothetical protein [Phycisphaerales bacterium]
MTQIDKRLPPGRSEGEPKAAGEEKILLRPAKLSDEERRKRAELLRLMGEWMADESGEQERSWEIAEKLLKENALSDRNR